jgi:hypothetical protein
VQRVLGMPSVHTTGGEEPPRRSAASATTTGFSHTNTVLAAKLIFSLVM